MKNIYFSELDPSRLDKKNGVVYGCAVCREGPAKGHSLTVTKTTLRELYDASQANGDKVVVKLDHRSGIKEVAGFLTDFQLDGTTLRADLHLLKDQANFRHTWSLIENLHDTCGLSCSFTGEGKDGEASCRDLISVDLVPHPDCGNGLFSRGDDDDATEDTDMNEQPMTIEEMLQTILDHQEELLERVALVEQQQNEIQDALDALEADDDESGEDEDQDEADDGDDADDEGGDDEAVLQERGARRGPQGYAATYAASNNFAARVEAFQLAGKSPRESHIEALKEWARSQHNIINL